MAGLFALPLTLLIVDVAVRLRVVRAFSAVEWSCYLASVLLMTGVYLGVVAALRRLGRRWPGWLARVVVALVVLVTLGAGYGAYLANGDLPDQFLLSYIRCEPENARILFRDSLRWSHVLGLLLGIAVLSGWLDLACRLAPVLNLRGWRRWGAVLVVCWLATWYCWHGTADRGQCFVPLVRIPAVLFLYGHNEIKGINPKPIQLPARQPLAVPSLPQSPVNVLVILNESLRRQNLGLYGHPRDTTPYMARFAVEHEANFHLFRHAYTNSTTTLLSVPSILTGISPLQPLPYRVNAPLLWQWATAADMDSFYFTSHDLAWCNLGNFITTPPPDAFWDQLSGGAPHYRDLGCDDHITVEHAVSYLTASRHASRPFLGVVHLNCNHYPYNTRADYRRWQGSEEDDYDNTILETDTQTGRLIDALSAAGKLENTVILFASDHGEAFNEHGYIAHFYCHFTETISVPLWLYLPPSFSRTHDPAALRANLDATVQNLDIMPTILDCIGAWDNAASARLRKPMLGSSLLRPLPPQRTVFITNTDEVINSVIGLSSVTGNHHYTLRTSSTPAREDLYDLAADPEEKHNLWGSLQPSERDAIRRRFLEFPVAARMMRAAMPHL